MKMRTAVKMNNKQYTVVERERTESCHCVECVPGTVVCFFLLEYLHFDNVVCSSVVNVPCTTTNCRVQ